MKKQLLMAPVVLLLSVSVAQGMWCGSSYEEVDVITSFFYAIEEGNGAKAMMLVDDVQGKLSFLEIVSLLSDAQQRIEDHNNKYYGFGALIPQDLRHIEVLLALVPSDID